MSLGYGALFSQFAHHRPGSSSCWKGQEPPELPRDWHRAQLAHSSDCPLSSELGGKALARLHQTSGEALGRALAAQSSGSEIHSLKAPVPIFLATASPNGINYYYHSAL